MSRRKGVVRGPSVLVIAGLAVTGCSEPTPSGGGDEQPVDPPPAQQAQAPRQQVVRAYERFWNVSWVTDDPDQQWQDELVSVASDPILSQLQRRVQQQRSAGLRLYGQVTPHVSDVRLDGGTAVVHDCQDASAAGQATLAGERKTRGVQRNPITAHMVRREGRWTVSRVDYPRGEC